MKRPKKIVGWREWVGVPKLCGQKIKAKVDTGARTSALHVTDIKLLGKNRVSFVVHPSQDSSKPAIRASAPLVETRKIKSSVGTVTLRPVITTDLMIGTDRYETEITLVNRDMMGFRMLIGRKALRKKYLVDPGESFCLGSPKGKDKKENKTPPKHAKRKRKSKVKSKEKPS